MKFCRVLKILLDGCRNWCAWGDPKRVKLQDTLIAFRVIWCNGFLCIHFMKHHWKVQWRWYLDYIHRVVTCHKHVFLSLAFTLKDGSDYFRIWGFYAKKPQNALVLFLVVINAWELVRLTIQIMKKLFKIYPTVKTYWKFSRDTQNWQLFCFSWLILDT